MKLYDPEKKIWSGAKYDVIYNSNVNLGYLILNVLKKTPDMVTQVSADTDAEMTCREMRLRTMKIASYLMETNLKQGDVVGVIAANSENLAPVVFACLLLGLPINFLSPVMNEHDIIFMYSKTKPKAIFCDGNIAKNVQGAIDKMTIKPVIFTLMTKVAGLQFIDDWILVDFDEKNFVFPNTKHVDTLTAVILCSSGTTGLPKGVCHSHSQLIERMLPAWNLRECNYEVLFNFSSLYWMSGLWFVLVGTLYNLKRIITTKDFDPDWMINIFSRYRITHFLTSPSALVALLRNRDFMPLKSVKVLMASGSILSKGISQAIEPFLPNGMISSSYGTTEAGFLAESFNSSHRAGSVGVPAPNVQMKIVNDFGTKLGPNEEGEICVKPSVLFSGYFNDEESTKATIKDGWIFTGDIGYFDEEGFLFIIDRKKDVLKFNGYQVYPSELETIINEIDGVKKSCVVGVFEQDKGNDLIFGFVEKDPTKEQLSADYILEYVNNKVIDAKMLRGGVQFMKNFPTSPSGKIRRFDVKKVAQEFYDKTIKI